MTEITALSYENVFIIARLSDFVVFYWMRLIYVIFGLLLTFLYSKYLEHGGSLDVGEMRLEKGHILNIRIVTANRIRSK